MDFTEPKITPSKAQNAPSLWREYIDEYKSYILMERSYSTNTLEAYLEDCNKFFSFMEENYPNIVPQTTELVHLQEFLKFINQICTESEEDRVLKASTQRRIVSGVRSYFKFLLIKDIVESNPCALLETEKIEKRLPVVLSNEEVERMLSVIDRSTFRGYRDAVIIEVLYACGLRVSELLGLKTGDIFPTLEYIKVIGKGNKQRLVPIGKNAMKNLKIYKNTWRSQLNIAPKSQSYLFLNERGGRLTRQYVFQMIKQTAQTAGIKKNMHPHILRHSFATALILGGANLIAVKDMLGHASVVSTQVYTHLDVHHLKETIMLYHPHYNKKAWNKR